VLLLLTSRCSLTLPYCNVLALSIWHFHATKAHATKVTAVMTWLTVALSSDRGAI